MRRQWLRELADRAGIVPEYIDQTGRSVRKTSDVTREALLAVMGMDAPTEDAARAWLAELDYLDKERPLDPVRVVERDSKDAAIVSVRVPARGSAHARIEVESESGATWYLEGRGNRRIDLRLPTRLPYGYHKVRAQVTTNGVETETEQSLIVVPSHCVSPRAMLGDRKAMGVVANLYSVRREGDWGVGDFTTLMLLVEWAASRGAEFVGVNPLHALFNRGMDISPYSPVSRLFRNPLYIDVDEVPELVSSEAAREILNEGDARARLHSLRDAKFVDYDGVAELKNRVLTELHRDFSGRRGTRHNDYERFVRERDPELTRFATWMAIAESASMPDWRQWPEALRDPQSGATHAFQEAHSDRIDFHRWLQFEVHRQLGETASRASVLGMKIGVYQDLAIGTSPGGSDTWSYPELFLEGAAVGAPPDPYAANGQNWGLPPMDPRVMREQGYRYWIQLLRRAFEHSGALRIDHVMGLFRTFWIPNGMSGKQGAYVRYPSRDMLGILALESVRNNAIVVGEDLGTVPKDVPPALRKWGILSSKVLYFEKDRKGFKGAKRYEPLALATANTHDMATLAGFWTESDVAMREKVGLISAGGAKKAARERRAEKRQLLDALKLEAPKPYEEAQFPARLTSAVHEFLCSTPSCLVGLSLDDLLGETVPVNVPGVGQEHYPSWRRKTSKTVEEMQWSYSVDQAMNSGSRRAR